MSCAVVISVVAKLTGCEVSDFSFILREVAIGNYNARCLPSDRQPSVYSAGAKRRKVKKQVDRETCGISCMGLVREARNNGKSISGVHLGETGVASGRSTTVLQSCDDKKVAA